MIRKLVEAWMLEKIQIKLVVKKTRMSEIKKYTEIELMADLTLPMT